MPKAQVDDDNRGSTYLVTNLYSEQELKKVAQDYISEKIRDQNFSENIQYSNIRIFLSLLLISIGSYCTIFVQYKKEPLLMIKLLIAFFIVSTILFFWEIVFFEDIFMILRTNNVGKITLKKEKRKTQNEHSCCFACSKKAISFFPFFFISTQGGVVKLFFELDIQKSALVLTYKMNKQKHSTSFELRKLFNEDGFLVQNYADAMLKQFISNHGKIFKLCDNKKKA
ncbi:signal peptidase complex subunit 2, putative [Plasmodium knowlesi strain H]|uniref:Signal peptidase complex subunit 2 n=1 Tax=Plasmodium knowlesi (strain H) TaxID=5851 RepID=A0A1A7VKF6_PLAKH|nr:signal peptidase complex subunit 2, putative [Plasmodium knowlesi strain H]SBO28776.1 signal peptidase complex subunit 2, putative [Plasmodium knowlesi strain H]